MRKWLTACAAMFLFLSAPQAIWPKTEAPLQFVHVKLRLLTMGNKQGIKEAGSFGASLPVGQKGELHRLLTVDNESRHATLKLALRVSVTPTEDDEGVLHCVVLTDAAPVGKTVTSRARDFSFHHPGEQIMGLYADRATGTRVVLAISAALETKPVANVPAAMPPILFLVRVERWNGAQRVELEQVQLQSLDGESVGHDYSKRIPRWVDADSADEGDDPLDKLKVLDFSQKDAPVVQAGQGFTIELNPEGEKHKKKETESGKKDKDKPPPKKLHWDQESYHLTINPMALNDDRLSLEVRVTGIILNPETRRPFPPIDLEAEKDVLDEQPVPFYLTRETPKGPVGFAVWVIPKWSRPQREIPGQGNGSANSVSTSAAPTREGPGG
jgi:hypothetical protein